MDFTDRLAKLWNDAGIAFNVGADAETIACFEQRHSVSLPDDVRRVYSRFNGTLDFDPAFNSFWPLIDVDTVPAKLSDYAGVPNYSKIAENLPNADDYFVFADHSIWVYVYAVRLKGKHSATSPVLLIADGSTFVTISDSFLEFWDRYLSDPENIIAP